jgi:hypothetical protein
MQHCDTLVTGHSSQQVSNSQYCTHTHRPHDLNTTVFTVPMLCIMRTFSCLQLMNLSQRFGGGDMTEKKKTLPKMVTTLCSGFMMSRHFTCMIIGRNTGCISWKGQNHMQKERVTHSWFQISSQQTMAGFNCLMEKRVHKCCSELGRT